jgi:hypothetical protein
VAVTSHDGRPTEDPRNDRRAARSGESKGDGWRQPRSAAERAHDPDDGRPQQGAARAIQGAKKMDQVGLVSLILTPILALIPCY